MTNFCCPKNKAKPSLQKSKLQTKLGYHDLLDFRGGILQQHPAADLKSHFLVSKFDIRSLYQR